MMAASSNTTTTSIPMPATVLATVLRDGLLALLHTEEAGRLGLADRRYVL